MDISPFLIAMVEQKASDLFFSTAAPPNIKVDGVTKRLGDRAFAPGEIANLAHSMMNDRQIKQFEAELECNFGFSLAGQGRFRVNVFRQRGEVSMVVRYINATPTSFKSLHLPDFLGELVSRKHGLILIGGAAGSGKSTTLAAMIDYRNSQNTGHILTIEDPIEYMHSHKKCVVDQREVGTDTHSFDAALKNALREAPDVILIGEIREQQTMRHAVAYSETGHLCLSTIHASDAHETLDRIINFFPEENHEQLFLDLSRNLIAIICQRLVIMKNGKRLPCLEVLMMTPYMQELIQNGDLSKIQEAMDRHLDKNSSTFDEYLFKLYSNNIIAEDEALANASSRHNLKVKIKLSDNKQNKSK